MDGKMAIQPGMSTQTVPLKSFGFGLKAFKKFPELIPLTAIIGSACVAATAFMGYSLLTKPDVRIVKSSELPPWEKVGPTEKRKLWTPRQQYKPIPELEMLKKEVGSYRP